MSQNQKAESTPFERGYDAGYGGFENDPVADGIVAGSDDEGDWHEGWDTGHEAWLLSRDTAEDDEDAAWNALST